MSRSLHALRELVVRLLRVLHVRESALRVHVLLVLRVLDNGDVKYCSLSHVYWTARACQRTPKSVYSRIM